jgi:molybdate transport system ATP-binding protein
MTVTGLLLDIRFSISQPSNAAFALAVKCSLPAKGVTAIIGHSGSGKTSLLRCIAGLETKVTGSIQFAGQAWLNGTHSVPTHKRNIGYVFQEPSLFEHLTVKGNLEYGRKRSLLKSTSGQFSKVLSVLGIEHKLQQLPSELSGGERQRVAIARALLTQPQLLLMDEPLSSLDGPRKQEILPYLESLASEFSIPILYVTHSVDEVVSLADRAIVLEQGEITAQGSLSELSSTLDSKLVSTHGMGSIMTAKVIEKQTNYHLVKVQCNGCFLWITDLGYELGQSLTLRVLASDVSLSDVKPQGSSMLNHMPVEVIDFGSGSHPALRLVRVKAGDETLLVSVTLRSLHELNIQPRRSLWASVKSVAIVN